MWGHCAAFGDTCRYSRRAGPDCVATGRHDDGGFILDNGGGLEPLACLHVERDCTTWRIQYLAEAASNKAR